MIRSMTGFGKATAELPGQKITIEIRSLNSKQLDINLKVPASYRSREPEIRSLLSEKLERGKVDLTLTSESTGEVLHYSINRPLARKYYEELRNLMTELGEEDREGLLQAIIKMPDVIRSEHEELSDVEWKGIAGAIRDSVERLDAFRLQEGQALEKEFISRVRNIIERMSAIDPLEAKRTSDIKDRLRSDLSKLKETLQGKNGMDENRFEQELIYYLERMDFTEEKVRLMKHCEYFLETLNDPQSPGKKLGFIVQEMGREINTLGSKAYDAGIQKLVVQMKDELEKIKEQALNIL